jgi:hypothetical protein
MDNLYRADTPTGLGAVWRPRGRGLINPTLLFVWTKTAHESGIAAHGRVRMFSCFLYRSNRKIFLQRLILVE